MSLWLIGIDRKYLQPLPFIKKPCVVDICDRARQSKINRSGDKNGEGARVSNRAGGHGVVTLSTNNCLGAVGRSAADLSMASARFLGSQCRRAGNYSWHHHLKPDLSGCIWGDGFPSADGYSGGRRLYTGDSKQSFSECRGRIIALAHRITYRDAGRSGGRLAHWGGGGT